MNSTRRRRRAANVFAVGTPVVVAGELIESAWGNQVRADLIALDTGKAGIDANNTFTVQNTFHGANTFWAPGAGSGNPGIDRTGTNIAGNGPIRNRVELWPSNVSLANGPVDASASSTRVYPIHHALGRSPRPHHTVAFNV